VSTIRKILRTIFPILIVLVVSAGAVGITASSVNDSIVYPMLEKGATGAYVKTLQTRLNLWNVRPRLSVGGDFGQLTLESVEAFQMAKNLSDDGIVGPETWQALLATPPADPPAITISADVDSEMESLLNDGKGDTTKGYFEATSSALVAAAAGDYNSKFYDLGELLVKDGFSNTIIDLGREMNAAWYEWSEKRAPSSEPDAYILAWRQIVTTMRSVPGEHFKFLWAAYITNTSVAECWPGSAYVDYVGTDIFDWYGGPDGTYPLTASGALDHQEKWRQILTAKPGGLNWMAAFSRATGKPIIIPEWGLDFHTFGGQDDPLFITDMMAWMKAHDAIGLYWEQGHVSPASAAGGPLLVNQGASAQKNAPDAVNAMGNLMGGRLQYAGVYLPDGQRLSDSVDQPVLTPWEHAGYQLILSGPSSRTLRPSNRIPAHPSQETSHISLPAIQMRWRHSDKARNSWRGRKRNASPVWLGTVAELHHVAVAHDVVLALDADLACGAGGGH
jgi:Putative peptidoglycan binding domain/Glycosyl hydrolase family 26